MGADDNPITGLTVQSNVIDFDVVCGTSSAIVSLAQPHAVGGSSPFTFESATSPVYTAQTINLDLTADPVEVPIS